MNRTRAGVGMSLGGAARAESGGRAAGVMRTSVGGHARRRRRRGGAGEGAQVGAGGE